MSKVRYAVVGAGWISQEAFMPAAPQVENSEITAIVSGSTDQARQLADFYGIGHIYGYEDYDTLLAGDQIDAVYIALPNSMHADYAIRALRAGKHALVEKPLAISEEECAAMIAASEESGALLMTAYRLHSEPATARVIEMIQAGEIGEPRLFASTFSLQSDPANHRLLAEHWGGPLQDIGVYCVNAARHTLGAEPIEAHAITSKGNGDMRFTEVEATIAVTLRFPDDRLAQFIASFEGDDTDTYRIIGTEGVITVEHGYDFHVSPTVTLMKGQQSQRIEVEDTDHFGAMTTYFSDCIALGTRPVNDGEEGLADVRAMLAIEEAARTGRPQAIQSPPRPARPSSDTVRIVPRTDRRLVF